MDYDWPGNIRELENVIEHGFVLCNRDEMDIPDLPLELRQPGIAYPEPHGAGPDAAKTQSTPLDREKLLQVLHDSAWNKAEAGRRLGLSRTSIWKYMKKWDIPLQKA